MRTLLFAGLLYLMGVAAVLALKPSLMFKSDGEWKEFGIGRNPATHTWFPFWLFAIVWALVSYIIVVQILALTGVSTVSPTPNLNRSIINEIQSIEPEDLEIEPKPRVSRRKAAQLPTGYYMLNTAATEAAGGIPKYVYLGPAPEE